VTYSFVDAAWEQDFCANVTPIKLVNPIASQMAVMRSSLIGGLLGAVAYNMHHKQSRVRVFEVGRCFAPDTAGDGYQQPWRIGAVACGDAFHEQWGARPSRPVDFYDVKADLEALFQPGALTFEAAAHPSLHPGKSARVLLADHSIGWIGELHPRWRQKYDLTFVPVLFEVALREAAIHFLPKYTAIAKFPAVSRDLALIFDEDVTYQAVLDAVNAQKPAAIIDFSVFDIYRGSAVEKGKKSLAFRMLVQDTHKTMTDAEVDSVVSEIIKILQNRFNAKLR
jgi:phenylalanyl-tRNA synthetase beta chain